MQIETKFKTGAVVIDRIRAQYVEGLIKSKEYCVESDMKDMQLIYRFENNYGAHIIGYKNELCDLVVLKFTDKRDETALLKFKNKRYSNLRLIFAHLITAKGVDISAKKAVVLLKEIKEIECK